MQNEPTTHQKPLHTLPRVGTNKRNVVYVWFFHRPYVQFLLMVPAMAVMFTPVRYLSFPLLVLAVVVFKCWGSLRLYPLLTWIRIDENYVYKSLNVFLTLEKLSLKEIYITEARYHGIRYLIFSATPIQDTGWKAVAENKDMIVYPFCEDMKLDFPELFRYIPYK